MADIKALVRSDTQAQYDQILAPGNVPVDEQYTDANVLKGVTSEIPDPVIAPVDPAIEALNDAVVDQGSVFTETSTTLPP